MKKFYNKLVRDRIPEIIAADGRQCSTEVMSEDEYRRALLAKLVEEARESAEAEPGVTLRAKMYQEFSPKVALPQVWC